MSAVQGAGSALSGKPEDYVNNVRRVKCKGLTLISSVVGCRADVGHQGSEVC